MKILHVYKDYDPPVRGGMERHIALSCRFQRQWADVEALMCSRSHRTQVVWRDGTRVTEAGEWGRFQSAPVAPLFPWFMRRLRADVIVVHMPNPTAELGYLLTRPKGVLIVRYHSDVVRQARAMRFYAPLQMKFLRKAAMILPTSEPYLNTSPTLDGVRDRCRVVPLGILPEEFRTPDPALVAACHQRYGAKFILFSGVHRYYKGLRCLVEAAAALRAPLVIAGDGPERATCMALARERNLEIAFPGALTQPDLVAHLHACSLFVFPSVARTEAFGLSILEAHACGKPVIATRLGTGVEYANEDGKTGLNVPPDNPSKLAEAVNALLENPGLCLRMGEYARTRVEREFNAQSVAWQEFLIYQEVAGCISNNT